MINIHCTIISSHESIIYYAFINCHLVHIYAKCLKCYIHMINYGPYMSRTWFLFFLAFVTLYCGVCHTSHYTGQRENANITVPKPFSELQNSVYPRESRLLWYIGISSTHSSSSRRRLFGGLFRLPIRHSLTGTLQNLAHCIFLTQCPSFGKFNRWWRLPRNILCLE